MDKKYALKRFGQNFLQDKKILNKIVNSINIDNKNIIEIGPGKGALSKLILEKANKLVAFEIDYNLFEFLNQEIKNKNFLLYNEDFLKVNLNQYKDYSIMANIPYNITTPILFKIFENHNNFNDVILMVQKEVADRMIAKPGTKNYGKLTITTSNFAEIKKMFDIPPQSFYPSPKVDSSIIYLKMKKNDLINDNKEFLTFIKSCFLMRRKTLINNLKKIKNYDEQKINFFYLKNNLKEDARPQTLTLEQYKNLFKLFEKQNKKQNI